MKFDKDNKIKDAKFLSYGCPANMAAGSALTEIIKGKTIEDADKICIGDIERELGGLPSAKKHCAELATKALKKSLDEYKEK